MLFEELKNRDTIKLYAGDIVRHSKKYNEYIGLSLTQSNEKHIKHNLINLIPLDDETVDVFQSEDVFEHIDYNKLTDIINEIYRILKPNSLFRLSVPDYNCDVLYKRSIYDFNKNIIYDPDGGGTFENPGHTWFPTYDNVKFLLEKTLFAKDGKIEFLHYWINKEKFVANTINYSKGYVQRTPDNDVRVQNPYRPMSIVVDLYKGNN